MKNQIKKVPGWQIYVSKDGKAYRYFKGKDEFVEAKYKIVNNYIKLYIVPDEGGKPYFTSVHRLVAFAFDLLDDLKYDGIHQVDHIDFDRTNNSLENLQVLTMEENIERSIPNIHDALDKPVKAIVISTGEVEYYPSITSAAKYLHGNSNIDTTRKNINNVLTKRQKTSHDRYWYYDNDNNI